MNPDGTAVHSPRSPHASLPLRHLRRLVASGTALAWQEWQGTITVAGAEIDVVCDNGETYACTGAGFGGTELETIQYGAALAAQCCQDNGTSYVDGGWDLTPVGGPLEVDRDGALTPAGLKQAVATLDRLIASDTVHVLERVGKPGKDIAQNPVCIFEDPDGMLACCQTPGEPDFYLGHCADCACGDGTCEDVDGRVGSPGSVLAMADYWTDLAAE